MPFYIDPSSRDPMELAPGVRTRTFWGEQMLLSPVLAFNDLKDQSDSDEQEGMMHLYEGVSLGIRNPRGHGFPEDTPERAFEYICLVSLLANRLEEAHRTNE